MIPNTLQDWAANRLKTNLAFCHSNQNFCHAGGYYGDDPNYGMPHIAGAVYWEDGSTSYATRCIKCGSSNIGYNGVNFGT